GLLVKEKCWFSYLSVWYKALQIWRMQLSGYADEDVEVFSGRLCGWYLLLHYGHKFMINL
ncbi:MAG: hypothetical protein K2M80_00440, partial [Muribaculaceae bacterium]|nr:hypothetical protein [Muribaculaceae bacterium]